MALGNVKPSDNEAKNKELIQSLRRELAAAKKMPQQQQQWTPGHQSQRQAVAHVGQQAQSWSSDQAHSSDYAQASQSRHSGGGYDGGGPSSASAHGAEYLVANVNDRYG